MDTHVIFLMVFLYLMQALIAIIINLVNNTRIPMSAADFLKLTFLPHVLLNLDSIKK